MDNHEKIKAYLAGELPLEEAQAFEKAMGEDPELAMAFELHHLDENLSRFEKNELDMELNGWMPGLEALQHSGVPLWLMSLLTGALVVGMAGARSPRREKQKSPASNAEASAPGDERNAPAGGGAPSSDGGTPPGRSLIR